MFWVTFRKKGSERRKSYKKENGAIKASYIFLRDNQDDPLSLVTLMSPHNPVRVFRCPHETGYENNKKTDFYSSQKWKSLRFEVLSIFGSTCMCCNASKEDGVIIDVDHVYPRSRFPELALEMVNLQVLCNACNEGKLHNKIIDFRSQEHKNALTDKVRELGIDCQH